ncbi:MAG: hypothetical protein ACM3PW_12965 [Chlamydiota bacterium]
MIQRLIAQGVVWAMLAGMCAPLAPAAAMPHACCLRHQQHCQMPHDAGVSAPNCCHECCRLRAVSSALFTPVTPTGHAGLPAWLLVPLAGPASQPIHAPAEHSGRAPPQAS